ncbi:nuclear RNA export factor 1-like [Ostrinia furnacalis]|uniref:nuclear RNA export factor 1-like n=1 Tax=Ostrinia furnacalis TaxID=93504 RepID=UPI00103B1683|nr:nuclear RNA export factor 1-like [Ostrinia furnacalis]
MATKRTQLEHYRRSLLNRVTANASFVEYIENCLSREDEAAKYSFHKVMVHNWSGTEAQLFDTLSEYCNTAIIPVMFSSQSEITSFYTSSLGLILRLIKVDFMFPFQRNMFNVDILFNDKNSVDCFQNTVTIEDIVCGVVSRRFSEKCELDLSNFCNDPEFVEKKISFYKITLLSHFKILMLRMGRDTKSLILSENNLSQVPLDILNFFIKGDLTSINLSNNNIPSLQELFRISSKIEKLWLEGNPLCEDIDSIEYIKNIAIKFPRLSELDGIKVNQHGWSFPFFRNYLSTPDKKTKMVVEKFLALYFTYYDDKSNRKIDSFYDIAAALTMMSNFTEDEEQEIPQYGQCTRNILNPQKRRFTLYNQKIYRGRQAVVNQLANLPPCQHDPTSFTIDVTLHNNKSLFLIVDGVYREENHKSIKQPDYRYYQFRRSFVFKVEVVKSKYSYFITNEIFSVTWASKDVIKACFQNPIRNLNDLCLIYPDPDESEAVIKAFMHITHLKKSEAEARLRIESWDIRNALKVFMSHYQTNKISFDKFIEDDDFSDTSSLIDDDIDHID